LKVTMQLDVVALTLARVQGDPVNDPVAVPPLVKATVPSGADAVPATEVSLTNPVQLTVWATTTVVGEHATAVDVVLRVTVTVLLGVGPLGVCTPSVGLYVPLAMTVPELVGVNVTLQLETVPLMLARVHGLPVNEPDAEPPLVNDTVPPGAEAVPVAVSLTKPVQVVAWLTTIDVGEHVTTVEVDLVAPTVTVLLVPKLPL
jgi:hypothetical protein